MSFIALPPDPASPDGEELAGDGFWPGVDPNLMRDELRIGSIVTHARLLGALKGAMISADGELAAWRAKREAEGAATLAEIEPARTIAGEHRLSVLYKRIVQFLAAAELAELHRDISATQDGHARADGEIMTARDYNRLAIEAVRDVLGTSRTAVELI